MELVGNRSGNVLEVNVKQQGDEGKQAVQCPCDGRVQHAVVSGLSGYFFRFTANGVPGHPEVRIQNPIQSDI